jgi:hypothetical protein
MSTTEPWRSTAARRSTSVSHSGVTSPNCVMSGDSGVRSTFGTLGGGEDYHPKGQGRGVGVQDFRRLKTRTARIPAAVVGLQSRLGCWHSRSSSIGHRPRSITPRGRCRSDCQPVHQAVADGFGAGAALEDRLLHLADGLGDADLAGGLLMRRVSGEPDPNGFTLTYAGDFLQRSTSRVR